MASAKVRERKTRTRPSQASLRENGVATPTSSTMSDSEEEGETKQKYQLQDLELKTILGTGTFGRVVLARHKPTKKYFALKVLTICEVIRLKQTEHVKSEKAILQAVKHPFIVHMFWADHDDRYLYMLLEFICGGELFSYLRNAGRFNVASANFYSAEIICALDYLHGRSIVYRDLKPENLLLDREGHLKLTDFGFAKTLEDRTWTLCGTPEYLAPEIIQAKGHNRAVDWWALGILVYEMLIGYPPFYDENPFTIYEKILQGKIEWPKHIDPVAKDLIRKLLVQDRTKRLGNMRNGADDVKKHKWFRQLSWEDVLARKLKPPVIPKITHRGDTRNFLEYPPDDFLNEKLGYRHHNELNGSPGQAPIVPKVDHCGDTSNFDEYADDGYKKAPSVSPEAYKDFIDF